MHRVAVLVMRRAGLSDAAFAAGWLERLVPRIAAAADGWPALRRLVVNVPPARLDLSVAQVFPKPFDGLLELWCDTAGDAAAAMAALASDEALPAAAADVVDGASGVAWLAEVFLTKPESGTAIKFLAAGEVAQGMSLADAQAYWRDRHPVVAKTAPAIWDALTRYTQFHGRADPPLSTAAWLARTRFVPMCSDMGFASQSGFIGAYTSDQYAAIVRPDEETFSRPGEMLAFVSAEERVLLDRQ